MQERRSGYRKPLSFIALPLLLGLLLMMVDETLVGSHGLHLRPLWNAGLFLIGPIPAFLLGLFWRDDGFQGRHLLSGIAGLGYVLLLAYLLSRVNREKDIASLIVFVNAAAYPVLWIVLPLLIGRGAYALWSLGLERGWLVVRKRE